MSTDTAGEGRLLGGYAGTMLLLVALGWAVIQTGRFLLPPLLPAIIDDLAISLSAAGLVLTAMQVVYAVIQYPSGRLSDRLGRATLIVPGLVVVVAGFLLIAVTTSLAPLVVAAALLGLGRGLFNVPSRALVSDHFVSNRGRALGVFTAGSDLGGVAASGLAVVVLAVATWRAGFWLVIALVAVLFAGYVHFNREPYTLERTDLGIVETVGRIAATREQRETIVAFSLFMFVANGVVNFLPAYLQATKGFQPALAGSVFALFFVLGMPVKPIAGSLSDRFPRRLISAGGLLLGAAALGALIAVDSLVGVVAATTAFALGYKAQFPVLDAILMDAAPAGATGGDIGAARTAFFAIGGLGAGYVGIVADRFGYTPAFVGLVVALLAAAALLLRHRRRGT